MVEAMQTLAYSIFREHVGQIVVLLSTDSDEGKFPIVPMFFYNRTKQFTENSNFQKSQRTA